MNRMSKTREFLNTAAAVLVVVVGLLATSSSAHAFLLVTGDFVGTKGVTGSFWYNADEPIEGGRSQKPLAGAIADAIGPEHVVHGTGVPHHYPRQSSLLSTSTSL